MPIISLVCLIIDNYHVDEYNGSDLFDYYCLIMIKIIKKLPLSTIGSVFLSVFLTVTIFEYRLRRMSEDRYKEVIVNTVSLALQRFSRQMQAYNIIDSSNIKNQQKKEFLQSMIVATIPQAICSDMDMIWSFRKNDKCSDDEYILKIEETYRMFPCNGNVFRILVVKSSDALDFISELDIPKDVIFMTHGDFDYEKDMKVDFLNKNGKYINLSLSQLKDSVVKEIFEQYGMQKWQEIFLENIRFYETSAISGHDMAISDDGYKIRCVLFSNGQKISARVATMIVSCPSYINTIRVNYEQLLPYFSDIKFKHFFPGNVTILSDRGTGSDDGSRMIHVNRWVPGGYGFAMLWNNVTDI